MRTRRGRLVLAAVITGTAVLGAGAAALALSRLAVGAAAPAAGWRRQGRALDFRLTQELRMVAAKAGASAGASGSDGPRAVTLRGTLRVLEATAAGPPAAATAAAATATGYQLLNADVLLPGETGAGDGDRGGAALLAALRRPFVVMSRGGRPVEARFAPDVPAPARNLLLSVIGDLRDRSAARATAPAVATERDLLGEHLAALTPERGGAGLHKRKLRYLHLNGAPDGGATGAVLPTLGATVVESDWRFAFDDAGRLIELQGRDRVAIVTGMEGVSPEVTTSVRIGGAAAFDAAAMAAELDALARRLVATPIITQETDPTSRRRAADRALVRGARLDDLFAELDAAAGAAASAPAGKDGSARARALAAVERLAALVRLDHATVTTLVRQTRTAPETRAQGIIAALGMAGSAPAAAALAALAADGTAGRGLRVAAVGALARVSVPDRELVAATRALVDDADADVRKAAGYAYGTMLETLSRTDPAAAGAALQALAARLDHAGDRAEQLAMLDILGNAADAVAWPALRRRLISDDEHVRAAAVSALRRVQAPGVEGALIEAMRQDPSPVVRAAAIFAAGFRDPTPFAEHLAPLALADPAGYVRNAAVALLGRALTTAPVATSTLAHVAQHDPRAEIRALAQKLRTTTPPR